uniref:Uncharacterized protein n=1 Tax=Anguilla anguilla TaxID=7936 RepID=A0A0E9PNE1_ANGAN
MCCRLARCELEICVKRKCTARFHILQSRENTVIECVH